MLPANRLPNVRRRVNRARNFPRNTCPASRHLHMIANALSMGRKVYPMLEEEPEHCAGTMYFVLESLWKLRTGVDDLVALIAALPADRPADRRRRDRLMKLARKLWPGATP